MSNLDREKRGEDSGVGFTFRDWWSGTTMLTESVQYDDQTGGVSTVCMFRPI